MDQQGFREDEMYRVEQFYMKKVMAIVDKLEGNSIIWQDPIETGAEVINELRAIFSLREIRDL